MSESGGRQKPAAGRWRPHARCRRHQPPLPLLGRLLGLLRYPYALLRDLWAGELNLRAMGLELSNEQVDFLLSTVVGDNLIDLAMNHDAVTRHIRHDLTLGRRAHQQ